MRLKPEALTQSSAELAPLIHSSATPMGSSPRDLSPLLALGLRTDTRHRNDGCEIPALIPQSLPDAASRESAYLTKVVYILAALLLG